MSLAGRPKWNENGFARAFSETSAAEWEAYARRRAQLAAIGVDVFRTGPRAFHTPYWAAIQERALEAGGPVKVAHRELVGALREIRSVKRYMSQPAIDQEHEGTKKTHAYLDDAIAMMRRSLAEGDADVSVTMCAECGERPRWFGDLCTACAEAAGTRPHGKVGEEL